MAIININQELFEKIVLQEKKTVIVEYWAPWCVYCRRIASAYERIAEQYEGKIEVAKVNIDENPKLEEQEAIEIIPTLVIYKDGKAVDSIVAPESKAQIEEFINKNLEV